MLVYINILLWYSRVSVAVSSKYIVMFYIFYKVKNEVVKTENKKKLKTHSNIQSLNLFI